MLIVDMRKMRSERSAEIDSQTGELVPYEAERLAKIVTLRNSCTIWRPVSYCLREAIRNVFEHARIDTCAIAAQRYGGTIEVAIADTGLCILRSLRERCEDLSSDPDELEMALQPGVSRVAATDDRGC